MKNKLYFIILIITIILVSLGLFYYFNLTTLENRIFSLKGSDEILINIGDKWNDPGVIYKDNDKDLSNEVIINNNVDLNKIGNYEIIYKVRVGIVSSKLKRVVKVIDKNSNSGLTFRLKGEINYYLINGNDYIEPGVEAIDKIDGNISNKVIKTGNVNNKENGNYELHYQVTNSNGITKELTRKIIVYSFELKSSLKYNEPVKENEINIVISDNNYNYTILPDNNKTNDKNINYKVNQNGTYTFNIYDKNNNSLKYDVLVNNIDNDSPKGTCEIILNDKGAEIVVDANDNDGIKGYIYKYGKNESELKENNKLSINTMDEDASVIIYDKAGNKSTITCKKIDKSTIINRSYTKEVFTSSQVKKYEYWFYKPKNSLRKKMPLLVYFHGDGGKKGIDYVNNYAYPAFIKDGMDFPFYMIAPYVNNEDDFATDNRMPKTYELINYIVKNNNIDPDQIIISGGSSGARGAYRMASKYKDLFSCMVIGSGITYQLYDKDLTHLPIWFFVGEKDSVVSYRTVENHVKNINAMGGNAKITVIKGGGHDITETVFKREDLIEWMVKQKKGVKSLSINPLLNLKLIN